MIAGALSAILLFSGFILALHVAARSLGIGGLRPNGVTVIWYVFFAALGAFIGG